MNALIARSWRFLAGLVLAFGLQPGAQAGLITGSWDPAFGSFLPNLHWQVKAEIVVPNACTSLADGDYSTAGGPCNVPSPANFLNVWLRFFNPNAGADPNDFFGYHPESGYFVLSSYLSVSQVRVRNGQIIGFQTNGVAPETFSCYSPCDTPDDYFSSIPAAEGNLFEFHFELAGPSLTCLGCVSTFAERMADPNNTAGRPNVAAATTDLEQFLVTYTSNTTSNPKFVDSSGNAVGTRLDGNGDFKGYSTSVAGAIVTTAIQVPEPGMLLLAGAALAALALSRRAARRG